MADPTRLKRAALRSWLVGCGVLGISLAFGAQAYGVTMTVATGDGVQGANLTLTWSLSRTGTDPAVGGAQIDIIFDTTQLHLVTPACVKDPRLTQQGLSEDLPGFPPVPAGHQRLRLAVFDDPQHPTASFDSGVLATCTFQVKADAPPNQAVALSTDRAQVTDVNYDLIPGVLVIVSPGQILPAPGTPTPTATPIPCFVDQDCPLGQVCNPISKTCEPAPTPTPTIACPNGNECPVGITCVNGICVDLSTPTPTPTPLPPCTSDSDCLDGFHCRANVCVPIRECDDANPALDRSMCRGVRETCTNGECECGGDCNLDGYVLSNETTQMICVLTGQCLLSTCAAGDFNGDGQITGNEVCAAVTNLGLGCPAEGQPLVIDRSAETRSLDIGTASGFPGDTVTIGVGLSGGGDVATAQLDVLFDKAVLALPHPDNPGLDCQVDPRLAATDQTFTFSPQTPPTPMGMERLRLFVGNIDICRDGLTYPVGAFDQGPLLSCTFHINAAAPFGVSALTGQRLNIGDPRGDVFGAAVTAGSVLVLGGAPTVTPSETSVTATPTNVPTNAPTGVPSLTPTPINTVPTPVASLTPTGAGPTATPIPTTTGPTATPVPTTTGPTATPNPTAATPTRTPSLAPTPTNTGPAATPTPTPTITVPGTPRTATPTATATIQSGGGGGGGGCTIATAAIPGGQLLWLGVPVGLFVMRRRARR